MTVVKICGLSELDDAIAALEAGADMLGFVFASSRRRVSPDRAADIIEECRRRFPPGLNPWKAVGVFANQELFEVQATGYGCKLDVIQLSGTEPIEYCRAVPLPLFKTMHLSRDSSLSAEEISHLKNEYGAERLLLDSGSKGRWGGTGERFAWQAVGSAAADCLVAGGLTPANVGDAIALLHPWGVDVSSGVESGGRKDRDLIRHFVEAAKRRIDNVNDR